MQGAYITLLLALLASVSALADDPCYTVALNYNGKPISDNDPGCDYCPATNVNGWSINTLPFSGKLETSASLVQYYTDDFGDRCTVYFSSSACHYVSPDGKQVCTCNYFLDKNPPTAKFINGEDRFVYGIATGRLWNQNDNNGPDCECRLSILNTPAACDYTAPSARCLQLKAIITTTCDTVASIDKLVGVLGSVCGGFTAVPGIIQSVGQIVDNSFKIFLDDAGPPLTQGQVAAQTIKAEYTLLFDLVARQLGLAGISSIAKLVAQNALQTILFGAFGLACKILDAVGAVNAICQIIGPTLKGSCLGKIKTRDLDMPIEITAREHKVNDSLDALHKRSTNPCSDLSVALSNFCVVASIIPPNCNIGTYAEAYEAAGYTQQQYDDYVANCNTIISNIAIARNMCSIQMATAAFEPFCDNAYIDPNTPTPSQIVLVKSRKARQAAKEGVF